jgi:hypothetical protein
MTRRLGGRRGGSQVLPKVATGAAVIVEAAAQRGLISEKGSGSTMKNTAATWLKTGAVGLAGLVAGGVLAATLSANAEDAGAGRTAQGSGSGSPPINDRGNRDLSQPQRDDEQLLRGDTLAKVKEAALATYPDATVVRIESDSDGVYEAHLTKADGTPVTVEVDKSFAVSGEEAMGHGGHGGFGGPAGPPPTQDDDMPESGDTT